MSNADQSKANKKEKTSLKQKWKKIKKRWKFLFLIIVFFLIWWPISSQLKKNKIEELKTIEVVTKTDLIKEAVRTGQIELQGVIQVTPQISGVITDLKVENGDRVKKGQILFNVQSTASQAEKAQAWASYLAAKNAYVDAQIGIGDSEWGSFESAKSAIISIERQIEIFENERPNEKDSKEYQTLKSNEAAARHSLNIAEKTTATTQDRLKAAKASVDAAAQSYQLTKDAKYTAPIDGVIQNIGVNVGENVTAGVGDKEGTPLFLIVPDTKKTIGMQIGPTDATLIQIGQPGIVKNDSFPEATFSAQIVRIDKVGKQTDKGLTYRAWLELDDPEDKLLIGMPVEITITVDERKQVLTLPQSAVTMGEVTLTNEAKEVLEKRTVKTGLKANGRIEIVEGLNEGDLVLIQGK